MAKIFELKQNRAELTAQMRGMIDKYDGAEMPGEDKAALAKMESDFDTLNARITGEEKQLERERIAGEKPIDEARKENPKALERLDAFRNVLRDGSQSAMQIYAALQQDNPTQAGYLVAPEQFVSDLIKELADATFMRQKAKVLPPLSGAQSLGYPTRTAGMASFAWGTELQAPTADTTLAFGKREFKPRPGTSEILVSKTLVRNVANVDALIRGEIADEVGAKLETAYMTGNGANCPLGLFVASADGINTDRDIATGNTATEIKFDGLMEAKYAIKDKYQPRCEWVFHRDAIKKIVKLKDSNGQYIWQPSVQMGAPDMLLGKRVNSSEYAPNTFTAGLYVGLYGDLTNYWICDSMGMEIQVLAELYARTNQIDYLCRIETDGAPVMPAAFARVTLGQ